MSKSSDRMFLVVLCIMLPSAVGYDSQFHSSIFVHNALAISTGSPIVIYRDTYSPTSEVHISIRAPDFNSNQYGLDTIGDDSNGRVTISTREGSIPYKLVETGPDTGIFAGSVILSGTTSTCSPVCGPTDGFLAAGGDDGITVSFSYGVGGAITATSTGLPQNNIDRQSIPEFGPLSGLVMILSTISIIAYSKRFIKN